MFDFFDYILTDYDFNDELNQDTAYAKKADIKIPVTELNVTNAKEAGQLKIGDKLQLKTTALPELADGKNLTWKSSDDTILTVTQDGTVQAKKAGTASVTVTETGSGVKTSVKVTVSDIFIAGLSIANAEEVKSLAAGVSKQLVVSMSPKNVTKKKLVWSSSNEVVAGVSKEGVVTAKKGGTATITVKDVYSGKEASVLVTPSYTLGAPVSSAKKQTLKLKRSTDFVGNYLSWNKIKGASYYRIYIASQKKEKNKYVYRFKKGKKVKKRYYYDTKIEKGKKYKYYIKAFSKTGKVIGKKSNTVKIKATAPALTVTADKAYSLSLNWEPDVEKPLKKIKGYRIYRSKTRNGKYTCVKQVNKKKTFTWRDTGRKENTTYYYKVCAFRKDKKKVINGAYSNIASDSTIPVTANLKYFQSMENTWKGVCMEKGSFTEEQSSQRMKYYGLAKDKNMNDILYPYIKYHLTSDMLYIHVYVRFTQYQGTTEVAKPSLNQYGVYSGIKTGAGESYKNTFIKGVTEMYDTSVTGSVNDFTPGVRFGVKLIVHEEENEPKGTKQQFLEVCIGGDCPECVTKEDGGVNHWFHAHPANEKSVFSTENSIYISENDKLENSGEKKEMETWGEMKRDCGHELSHILGLDDGYTNEQCPVDRMTENEETCFGDENRWYNIMLNSRKCPHPTSNDIEMILHAYKMSVEDAGYPLQSYKKYEWKNWKYDISKVIRQKDIDMDKKEGK